MTHKFIKLLLAFALLSTLAACNDNENNNAPSGPVTSGNDDQPPANDVPPVVTPTEEPNEEVVDLSWVPKETVACREKGCIPSVPLIFARPTPYAKGGSLSHCMGVLVDENTVVASGNCLPNDVAEGKVSCKSRVFVKFPSVDSVLPERGVGCDSIEKFSITESKPEKGRYSYLDSTSAEEETASDEKNEEKNKFKPSFMVIKLTEPIHRINYSMKNYNSFRSGEQYIVGKLEGDLSYSGTSRIDYKLTSQLCPTIENTSTAAAKTSDVVALDCDLSLSAGAPIFDQSWGGKLSLTGIVHSHFMTGSNIADQLGSIMGPSTFRYKVYLGFSHRCIDNIDCNGIEFDSFLKGDPVEDQSGTVESARKQMEGWAERSPLSRVIQWEIVEDISEYEQEGFALFVYPTIENHFWSSFNRTDTIKYKEYTMSMPIPKCAKTMNPERWIEAYLALDTITDSQRSSLERNYSGKVLTTGPYMPTDDYEFNLTTRIRKEYEAIGASNYIGQRKFKIEVDTYGEDEERLTRVTMTSYTLGGEDIAYTKELPLCESE